MDWGSIVAVVITGLVVVFLALIGLVLILYITGWIVPQIDKLGKKKKTGEPVKSAAPAAVAAAPVRAEFVPQAGPGPVGEAAVEDGIPGKTVAAISAAVTTALEGQGAFKVKTIKRAEKK